MYCFFAFISQTAYCLCLSCNVDLSGWASFAINQFSQEGFFLVPYIIQKNKGYKCFRKHSGYVSLLEPTIPVWAGNTLCLDTLHPHLLVEESSCLLPVIVFHFLHSFIFTYFKAMFWSDLLKQPFMWWVNTFYSLANCADCDCHDYDFQSVVFE